MHNLLQGILPSIPVWPWSAPLEEISQEFTDVQLLSVQTHRSSLVIHSLEQLESLLVYGTIHNACCMHNMSVAIIMYTHAGVYLTHGTRIMTSPENTLLITDIGISPPHQLVCTSDRMPCCQDPPQYGEWKFPNGSQVLHISEGAVAFHRNRDNYGNVNLYRVSSDILSPAGRFCCEIEDATGTNHTLCVNMSKCLLLGFFMIDVYPSLSSHQDQWW